MASVIRKFTGCFLISLLCQPCFAQRMARPFWRDMAFAFYLQDQAQYQDVIIALNEIPLSFLNDSQRDSVNYLKGWNYYNMKSLDSSAYYLSQVSRESIFFLKSRFFGSYNNIYLRRYHKADSLLSHISDDSVTTEVKHFERAGIALLERDYQSFDNQEQGFTYARYALSAQERNFTSYKDQLVHQKRKSPVLAGVMSAVLPGSGKIYAGKTYQGIASIFPIAALALLTNESYHKRGPRSAEFYIFGSMLTVFYVGNIWGSVFSVKINRDENEKLVNQKILLDLQVPLRTIFN